MRLIETSDVLDIAAYEKVRDDYRRRAMAEKAVRRLAVGPLITVFFENRGTMLYQLQEIMRAERLVHDEQIANEMKVWNELIPADDELSLTLMVEETDLSKAKETLRRLKDLEESVSLAIGARTVRATFDQNWRDENRISAVQFIRFQLDPDDRRAFLTAPDVRFVIDHEHYGHEARLPDSMLAALRADLES